MLITVRAEETLVELNLTYLAMISALYQVVIY